MKKIFITPKIDYDKHNQSQTIINTEWYSYLSKLKYQAYSGYFKEEKDLIIISKNFDGLILSGGGEIFSKEKKFKNKLRDEFEIRLLKNFTKVEKPILCICRGFQLIGTKNNSKLVKTRNHIKTNHKIYNTKKNNIFNVRELNTNSFHKYMFKKLDKNFEVFYVSKDKSVEIAKIKNKKIFCFMFHPERKNQSQKNIDLFLKKIFK